MNFNYPVTISADVIIACVRCGGLGAIPAAQAYQMPGSTFSHWDPDDCRRHIEKRIAEAKR